MSTRAQIDGSDELGWILDVAIDAVRHTRPSPYGVCPKAVARAHARLLRERAELAACKELLSILSYWHDVAGHVDESWWDEARRLGGGKP